MIGEKTIPKQPSSAKTLNIVGPCPTIIEILVGRLGTESYTNPYTDLKLNA